MDEYKQDAAASEDESPRSGNRAGEEQSYTSINGTIPVAADLYTEQEPLYQEWTGDDESDESVPLSGEIYSYDTYFNKENELVRHRDTEFADELSEPMDAGAKDDNPYSPNRKDEFRRENGLIGSMLDTRTEFAGELSPAQIRHPGFGRTGGEMRTEAPAESLDGQEAAPARRDTTFGWIAIILAIGSLFFWPAVLGPAAAVLGVVAYLRGNRALGVWSIALGLISVLAFLFLVPYYS